MSTEKISFGFNSLIPETYKTKAEAFARCLQHKLLSLGGLETSSDSFSNSESRKRLTNDPQNEENSNVFPGVRPEYKKQIFYEKINVDAEDRKSRMETSPKLNKTEDSDDEFCSHSESENSDLFENKMQKGKEVGGTKKKLISMSSEDSTMDSWSSCQENLTDVEKFDSENEEVNYFAHQIKGSPKLRNFNIRCKRKEMREKPWKKSSRKNYSSSTESVDSEGRGIKTGNHQLENFDSDSNPQYILLDGLEDDEIPHRVLRESSSTSNLERHFSGSFDDFDLAKNQLSEKDDNEKEKITGRNLLTPPPSPELNRTSHWEEHGMPKFKEVSEAEIKPKTYDLTNLKFADLGTESLEFLEVECMEDFKIDEISIPVKKEGGVIVECLSDCHRTNLEESKLVFKDLIVTSIEVLQNTSEASKDEAEKEVANVPVKIVEEKSIETEEDEDLLEDRSKLRRCSSLKTWKTPPGTPGSKKIVRFADALGLDLIDVRTFLDEIPKIPSSAYEDLHFDAQSNNDSINPPPPPIPTLIPLFQQPGTKMDFLEKVQQQKVCLESAIVTDTGVLTITGFVRVQNISFHKSVYVRYSLNNWETYCDLQATYVANSCDGFSDKFSFVLYGHTLKIGQKMEFALRLECNGNHYWDNNGGINYVFNCLPLSSANSFFSSLCSNRIDPWFDFY